MPQPTRFPRVTLGLLLAGAFGAPLAFGADNASSVIQPKSGPGPAAHPAAQPVPATWLNAEAKKLSKGDVSVEAVRSAARQQLRHSGAAATSADIESLTLIILRKASADAEADLRAMNAQMKATAERKAAQRDASKQKKDELAEMNQQDQLKLQMLMDRRAKLEEMISQIMKKSADTASGTVGNLK